MTYRTLFLTVATIAGFTSLSVQGQAPTGSPLINLNAQMKPGLWEVEVKAHNAETLIQKVCVSPQDATDTVTHLTLPPSDSGDCVFTHRTLQDGIINAEAICTHSGRTTKMTMRGTYTPETFQINIEPDTDVIDTPSSLAATSARGHHKSQNCS